MPPELSLIIVDDMRFSRVVLEQSLQKCGYSDIRMAANGSQVLEMTEERRADVILADWVMPEMSGLDLLDAIRKLDEQRHWYTAVILLTANEGDEHLLTAFQHGVDDYLTKPPNIDELAARVYGAGRMASLHNVLLQTTEALQAENLALLASHQIDSLTGLGNRRYLEQQLKGMLESARTRDSGLCLALASIDHLKRINQTYSYDIGDEMIANVALRLRNSIRPTDVITRFSGGTFAIAIPYTKDNPPHPKLFARLVDSIATRDYQSDAGKINLTLSLGAHCYQSGAPVESLRTFIRMAEDQLERIQAHGGNDYSHS